MIINVTTQPTAGQKLRLSIVLSARKVVISLPPLYKATIGNSTVEGIECLANLLIALSPLFLWRLRHGKGQWYSVQFVIAAAAMWCSLVINIGPRIAPLIGYVVWCLAGLLVLCAFRMRWAMLPLTTLAPFLVWMSE